MGPPSVPPSNPIIALRLTLPVAVGGPARGPSEPAAALAGPEANGRSAGWAAAAGPDHAGPLEPSRRRTRRHTRDGHWRRVEERVKNRNELTVCDGQEQLELERGEARLTQRNSTSGAEDSLFWSVSERSNYDNSCSGPGEIEAGLGGQTAAEQPCKIRFF